MSNVTLLEAEVAVENYFTAQWGDNSIVAWDNKPRPPTVDGEDFLDDYWVAFSFEVTDSFPKAVSDEVEYRYLGRIVIDVHMRKNLGPALFSTIVQTLNGIFRGKTLSGVRVSAPIISPQIGDDSWYRRVVSYPINFDDK